MGGTLEERGQHDRDRRVERLRRSRGGRDLPPRGFDPSHLAAGCDPGRRLHDGRPGRPARHARWPASSATRCASTSSSTARPTASTARTCTIRSALIGSLLQPRPRDGERHRDPRLRHEHRSVSRRQPLPLGGTMTARPSRIATEIDPEAMTAELIARLAPRRQRPVQLSTTAQTGGGSAPHGHPLGRRTASRSSSSPLPASPWPAASPSPASRIRSRSPSRPSPTCWPSILGVAMLVAVVV